MPWTSARKRRNCTGTVEADSARPPLLRVADLRIEVPENGHRRTLVDGVSFAVGPGERVALVGESGSGKSLTALACLGLTPEPTVIAGGSIQVDGAELMNLDEASARHLRGGRLALVFQEPSSSLNPVLSIGYQIRETLHAHRPMDRGAAVREALGLLEEVGLEPAGEVARAYPHQLSGGQAQRAALAVALAGAPSLLIADEPTTGLDTTAQHAILALLLRLSTERSMGLLLITHDLAVAAVIARSCRIMYAGEIVETGPMDGILSAPIHPYTRLLLGRTAVQRPHAPAPLPEAPAAGPVAGTPGCRFAPRCPLREPGCGTEHPSLAPAGEGRTVRCPVVLRRPSP